MRDAVGPRFDTGVNEPPHAVVSRAIREVRAALTEAGGDSPDAEARALVAHAARAEKSLVLIDALPEDFSTVLAGMVARRVRHEPLQLILGRTVFRRVSLEVKRGVFIPRPETEVGVDVVHEWYRSYGHAGDDLHAIDACCGSGTLGVSIANEFPRSRVHSFDLNPEAVELTRTNFGRLGSEAQWSVAHARLPMDVTGLSRLEALAAVGIAAADSLTHRVDVVVSNPPYIPANAIPRQREVLDYDPHEALFGGGADGLHTPAAVISFAALALAPGGLLVMEHADVQGQQTRSLADASGVFTNIRTVKDLAGKDRFLAAERCTNLPHKK